LKYSGPEMDARKLPAECTICLNDFGEGDTVSPLHCNVRHAFHTDCIVQWLTSNPVCPLCKTDITSKEQAVFNKELKVLMHDKSAEGGPRGRKKPTADRSSNSKYQPPSAPQND